MTTIHLDGLHKTFGEVVALENFELEVATGELVSLLGPSGCGKTTALRIVAGFENPDRGRVLVGGDDLTHVPVNARDMGMVFQAYSLFPNMTVRQNVEFGLRLRRRPHAEREKRSGDLLDLVGLAPQRDRYPHQLSGGQQQRVALARALAIEPRVLLLDEPLSALDARVRLQLRDEIRRIQTEVGITTLFVTHDQEEALSIADRVGVMSKGRLEQIGPPAEIYARPATAFVASFVGTMNHLPAVVVDPASGTVECRGFRLTVDAVRAEQRALQESLVVMVRPESVRTVPRSNGVSPGELPATVVSTSFFGSVTRLRLRLDGDLAPAVFLASDIPSVDTAEFPAGTAVAASFSSKSALLASAD